MSMMPTGRNPSRPAGICVDRITLREVRIPLLEPFEIATGRTTERRVVLLELLDADGIAAWSECVAGEDASYSPETADTAWMAIREWIAPRVLHHRFAGPREVFADVDRDIRGHRMAKAAVEMGCWGLAALRADMSLTHLLGGTRVRVATGQTLGIDPRPGVLAVKARRALASGFRKVKLKIRPGADFEPLAELRELLGPDVPLAADANGSYTLADAERLARLDSLNLLMLEQPLAADDLVRHASLQKLLRTPICLDESIDSARRTEDMIALGSAKIVNLKPGRVGGFGPSLQIHRLCSEAKIPLWCGGMLESGLGRAYNVALAALPGFSLPGDLYPPRGYLSTDIVEPEWTLGGDGCILVPLDRPGVGVTVDRERLEPLIVREEVLAS